MSRIDRGRALVIGSQGFLGRHIATALGRAGFDVFPAVRTASGQDGEIAFDLLTESADGLRTVLDRTRPTVVVNAAGIVTGTAPDLVDANVVAPLRLLTAMVAVAPTAQYIHLGSAAEYGSAVADRAVDEDDDPRPLGSYGVSKLAGTKAVLALSGDSGQDSSVLRIFNPVGSGSPTASLPGRLAHLLRTVADQGPLSIGPLDAFRDFVDVRDVGHAVVACTRVKVPGRVYNIGSGRATGSRVLAERLMELAGHPGTLHEEAPPSERSGTLAWQQANISRAAAELDWSPQHDFTDSLLDLWRYST